MEGSRVKCLGASQSIQCCTGSKSRAGLVLPLCLLREHSGPPEAREEWEHNFAISNAGFSSAPVEAMRYLLEL